MDILRKPAEAEQTLAEMYNPGKFCRSLQKEETSTGSAGQTNRDAPAGPTEADVALNGREQRGGPLGRLHSGGARLSREKQGCEVLLSDDGNIAQRAGQHGRAERLLRRRVLLQER